ncbi:MAG: TetR/AcrR family transcriptional regulator, partial [Acidimicrobiia bacterium]
MPNRRPGRPRDVELDDAIVEAAREVLSELGVDGVTFERVASRAGTTRPALYRRYPSRTDLVLDALASLRETRAPRLTGDHHRDLVAELTAFRDAITQAHSTALAGSMLLAATDDQTKAAYRDRVVAPRRRRLAQIIDAACADG